MLSAFPLSLSSNWPSCPFCPHTLLSLPIIFLDLSNHWLTAWYQGRHLFFLFSWKYPMLPSKNFAIPRPMHNTLRHVIKAQKVPNFRAIKPYFQVCFFHFLMWCALIPKSSKMQWKTKNAKFFSGSWSGLPCIQGITKNWCCNKLQYHWDFTKFWSVIELL